jgi:hypothetical protein
MTLCYNRNLEFKEEYLNLLSVYPKISDLISEVPLITLASKLERGRNEIKSSEVHSIAIREISNWGLGVPVDKNLRGFGNDSCGRFLCPSNRDWTDPMCVNCPSYFHVEPTNICTASDNRSNHLKSRSHTTISRVSFGRMSRLTCRT